MTDLELEQRKERAASETLVIAPTDGGFRVYNPGNISHIYMVSGIPETPTCNCPDFEMHKSDPEWRCKHILTVLNQLDKRRDPKATSESSTQVQNDAIPAKPSEPTEKKKARTPRNGNHSHMVIKRSVSPDGRIDSLSVEFLKPINGADDEIIKEQAQTVLKLQNEIVSEFLKDNGSRKPIAQTQAKGNGREPQEGTSGMTARQAASEADGMVTAQLLNIAGMNTRSGWKLFINVQVNGTTTKVFGSKRELGQFIAAAGFASIADHIDQGTMLNLPCLVATKRSQDGKYLNIDRVRPLKPLQENGGQRQ